MEGQDFFFSKNDIKSAKRKMEELKNSRCSLGLTVFWIVGQKIDGGGDEREWCNI